MNVFYSPDYVAAKEAFDTTRKSADVALSLVNAPIPKVNVVQPTPATVQEILTCHTREYVRAVQTGKPKQLASTSGFPWDSGIWIATTASTGGVITATLHAATMGENAGSLSSGLHHAYADHGAGFCTFNGLAIAAKMVAGHGKRVLILDLDAHNGGGTQSLVEDNDNIDQINISTSPYDWYETDRDNDYNLTIGKGKGYLHYIEEALSLADDDYDVIIYNAGMDPHEDCMTGGMSGITTSVLRKREEMVFDWARNHNIPVAFVLAGGYQSRYLTSEQLVGLHRLTIAEAAL